MKDELTLSERIASGDISQEVVEAVAVALGWERAIEPDEIVCALEGWKRSNVFVNACPNYLTDIRLTLDEIERRGWLSMHDTLAKGCLFMVGSQDALVHGREQRPDRNLALAAITALLRALGE